MKKPPIYLAAFALAAMASTGLALDLTTDTKAPANVTPATSPSTTQPAPVADAGAIGVMTGSSPTTPEETLIPIIVRDRPDKMNLSAGVTNLQTKGQQLGIEQMSIEGVNNEKPTELGTKEVTITWGTASVVGQNGQKYTTHITKPLNSVVETAPEGDVQTGTQFTAKGDPNELIAAWGRLQQLMGAETTSPTQATEKKEQAKTSAAAGGSEKDDEEDQIFTPNTQVKKDPVITSTSNGCNMNIDKDQMVAIVQERTLEDGKEIIACQDTLTRYPLEKKFGSCPVSVQDGQVYEQYTLAYKDPVSGGNIQVEDCTPDLERAKTITLDTNSCPVRHDMNARKTFQQGKRTYTDTNGGVITLQDCQDTGVTYDHVDTRDTCSPIIDMSGKTVTMQSRRKINVNGTDQFITECSAEGAAQAIQEEVCTSPRYTHDMPGKTSYLNKTLFYMDDGSRVEISNCQKSNVSFEHKQDSSQCTPINYDAQRQTVMYAKTFIEEEAGKPIILSECQALSPAIPYVKTGDVWKTQNTLKKEFTPTAKDLTPLNQVSDLVESKYSTGGACVNKQYSWLVNWSKMAPQYTYKGKAWAFNTDYIAYEPYGAFNSGCRVNGSGNASYEGNKMCVAGSDPANWTTSEGIKVDPIDSTQKPTTSATVTLQSMTELAPQDDVIGFQMNAAGAKATFSCPNASCNVTTLNANPVYLRGDNTTFTDLGTVTNVKYVCGDGSNLNGKAL